MGVIAGGLDGVNAAKSDCARDKETGQSRAVKMMDKRQVCFMGERLHKFRAIVLS